MTFKNYLKQQGYATKTIHNMERTAFDFLCWLDKQAMEVEQVEHRDILGYIKHLQNKEVQQITIERYIGALRLFFKFKVSSATLKTNPTSAIKIQGIKRKKLYHTFTSEELHKIYNGYDPGQIKRPVGKTEKEHLLIEKRNKVILGFYVYQGIQSSELYRLEVQHIKLREGVIEVPGTKRSNTRTLPLESHQVLDIYDYVLQVRKEILEISKQQTDQLLVSPKAGTDQSNYVSALMRELKRQNKLIVNAQQLRTSVIVKWLKQYNLIEVQQKAGHRYVSSTENFLVNQTEGLAEEISQFHPLG